MKKLFLKFLFLSFLVVLFSGLSFNCKKSNTTESPSPSASTSTTASAEPNKNDLTNLDPSSALDETKANFKVAQEKAILWHPDAVLYSTSAKITSTLDWQDVIEVYTFGSAQEPANWWTISISVRSKNYVRAIIPKEDYLGANLTPIALQYWKINYLEAFQTAEKNGGKDWRNNQKNSNYQITVTLAHAEPNNYLYFIVEYQNSDGSDKKTIQINANNGEVVNQES